MALSDYAEEWVEDLRSRLCFSWFYPTYIGQYVRRMHFWNALKGILKDGVPRNILEIGCGDGSYAYQVAKRFPSVSVKGIDLDIEIAENSWECRSNLSFERADVRWLTVADRYDVIYCIDVLDDVHEWILALNNMYVALKNLGYLYIHFPSHPRLLNVLRAKSIVEYWERDASYTRAECSADDLRTALKGLRFQILNERVTFGKVAVFVQEISLLTMMRKGLTWKVLRSTLHPLLKLIAKLDLIFLNQPGNGVAILCRKM